MDIPRIGYGALYRPPQTGVARTADGGPERPGAQTDTPDAGTLNKAGSGVQPAGGGKAPGAPLSEDEQKQVNKLKAVDAKVRQHEAAHQAAGGGLVGGASFTYTKGPDGRSYATGGEVPISAPAARSPDAAIQQARQIKAAALAPADPSGQDLAVAAAAEASQAQAQRQLNATTDASATGQGGDGSDGGSSGGDAGSETVAGLPEAAESETETETDAGSAISALVARGVAAYGAAARVNAAPSYATALFA